MAAINDVVTQGFGNGTLAPSSRTVVRGYGIGVIAIADTGEIGRPPLKMLIGRPPALMLIGRPPGSGTTVGESGT